MRIREADNDAALIRPVAFEIIPKVPVPERFKVVREPPVLLSVIKFVLLEVIDAVETPVPAISVKTFHSQWNC